MRNWSGGASRRSFCKRIQWRKKTRTSEPWVLVLRWCCCYGNRCRHPYGGHGVLKIMTTSKGWNSGEQHFKKPTNVNVQQAGGKFGRRALVRCLCCCWSFGLFLVAICDASCTVSPSLHDAFSTRVDASLPPGIFLSICTYTAATALHFGPKHPQNHQLLLRWNRKQAKT